MWILIESEKYGIKKCLFNSKDYSLIKKHHWRVNYVRGKFYALATICEKGKKVKTIKMHRLIMGVLDTPNIHIDHKDEDGLNNTRKNLRIATFGQNMQNRGANKRNTTGYKGVYMFKRGYQAGQFTAAIVVNKKKVFGGYFNTAEEAAIKYNKLAKEHHGEFAYKNKIK